ncbi:MAG: A/G-specific adenine glycosylase [Candidatus Accumulibacter sp.]|jgi:A/G-specific adenine glycosylase|nr:A/G-specific adenine glycosylase [Accumulibacter sp.]
MRAKPEKIEERGAAFSERLIAWQKSHGRHDLPWQKNRDAYRVWLSEVMLQQTQVGAVIPYYTRFLERFPTLAELAHAPLESVLELWSGLGYYARARNLHRCAQTLVAESGGVFPRDPREIARLQGIGKSTAAAIAVFSFGIRAAILDGNVKRVLARCFGIDGFPGEAKLENAMWALADSLLPEKNIESYTQGLMDLGSAICTRTKPLCGACPFRASCIACREGSQDRLPTPRPTKTRPERETGFLIVTDEARVLLERRPPTGIWGGLLGLPEGGVAEAREYAARCGARLLEMRMLPPFKHTFTHFHLKMLPLVCVVECTGNVAAEPGLEWVDFDRVETAALPSPVRALLKIARAGESEADLFAPNRRSGKKTAPQAHK